MELRIDDEANIAHIRITGRLDKETILAAFDAAVADEGYRNGMSRLWDFRDADLSSLDGSTIAEMARYSLKYPSGVNDVKVAFVASRQLEYGLSRMFEAYSSDARTSISVFYLMEDAISWLTE